MNAPSLTLVLETALRRISDARESTLARYAELERDVRQAVQQACDGQLEDARQTALAAAEIEYELRGDAPACDALCDALGAKSDAQLADEAAEAAEMRNQ